MTYIQQGDRVVIATSNVFDALKPYYLNSTPLEVLAVGNGMVRLSELPDDHGIRRGNVFHIRKDLVELLERAPIMDRAIVSGSIVVYVGDSKETRMMSWKQNRTQFKVEHSYEGIARVTLITTGYTCILKVSDLQRVDDYSNKDQKGEIMSVSVKKQEAAGLLNAIIRLKNLRELVEDGTITVNDAKFIAPIRDDEELDAGYDRLIKEYKDLADYERQEKLKELRAEADRLKSVEEKREDIRKQIEELEKA